MHVLKVSTSFWGSSTWNLIETDVFESLSVLAQAPHSDAYLHIFNGQYLCPGLNQTQGDAYLIYERDQKVKVMSVNDH